MICNSRFWCEQERWVRRAGSRKRERGRREELAYLEPLVLQNLLDGDVADRVRVLEEFCLEDDAEGAIADDFAVGVDEITGLSRLAVGSDDLDDLAGIVDGCGRDKAEKRQE